MIHLDVAAGDNVAFVHQVELVIAGAIRFHQPRLCSVYKVDNWFDHKWLGFFRGSRSKANKSKLANPPFANNRLVDGRFYLVEENKAFLRKHVKAPEMEPYMWELDSLIHNADEFTLHPRRMLVWYSGNTANNKRGVAMFYLIPDGEMSKTTATTFYVSSSEATGWQFNAVKGISFQEFEKIAAK